MNKSDYMAAIIDKHAEAAKIKGPKIIFAGGSNLAFGLNSEEIKQKFGVSVINLGLHWSLGLAFILNEVKDVVRENDIVVLSIEYYMPIEGIYQLEEDARHFYPKCGEYYNRNYLKEINYFFDQKHNDFKSIFSSDEISSGVADPIYSRNTFNNYGDHISHLKMKDFKRLGSRETFINKRWQGIEKINEFYTYSKVKGFRVYFLFPPYAQTQFQRNYEQIKRLESDALENMKTPILNKPEDVAFNDSLFFDNVYHLNKQGREKRTQRLIEIFSKNADILKDFKTATKK
jgi:hypothetical protein